MKIKAGARSSPLSKAQFEEIRSALHPRLVLEPVWAESPGDRDRTRSLRDLEKTDFFTRDLDQMLLSGKIRIAIHSAKDLPEPLSPGLVLAALTKGIGSQDSLVFREGESLPTLPAGSVIATSSQRREDNVKRLCPDFVITDLRGTIEERLAKLYTGEADGIVVAEAALIRLKLTHLNRIMLPGDTVPLQGRLAIIARSDDEEIIPLIKNQF
jgi:hydroxymethylbilane synthase